MSQLKSFKNQNIAFEISDNHKVKNFIMSRNHEEDQKSELEALESIYYNELESKLPIILKT